MKALFLTMSLLLMSSQIFAKCSLAFGFIGGSEKVHMAEKLRIALSSSLRELNEENYAYYASSPFEAAYADYYLLIRPSYTGFTISVNYNLLNERLFENTYRNSAFRSENEAIETIVYDLEASLFAQLSDCK